MFLVAVEERTNSFSRSQFFNSWTITFDFGVSRARCETDLLGEDIENAGKTNERGVFSNCSWREVAEV